MVSVFASSAVDRFKSKTLKIGICCFSAKHPALRRTGNHLFARNQDNVL